MNKLKFVDLFAGIGGFRQAASRVKLEGTILKPVAACEIDKYCKILYEEIFHTKKNNELFVDDIQEIVRGDGNEGSVTLPDFDVLFGGFPCQPFSNVGKRKGFEDPRGALFFDIVKILHFYKPNFFVLENVSKIMTIEKGTLLNSMVKELESAGYHVHYWDLYADQYGLPQKRHRLFFCGVKKSYSLKKENLQAPPPVPRQEWKYQTVWHLMERDMPLEHIIPDKTRETVLRPNPKWMGGLEINLPVARPITASMAKWHRANQDNYYSEKYVSSRNTNPFESPEVDLINDRIRRITPLEGFRLQGFPDEYATVCKDKKISFTTTYRMIGNAVPVDLTSCVIKHLLSEYMN